MIRTKLQTLLDEKIKELNMAQSEKVGTEKLCGKVNAHFFKLEGQVELLHELIMEEAIEETA